MMYSEVTGYDELPQWAKNRISYQVDKNLLNSLITENENWEKWHRLRENFSMSVAHQERVSQLKTLLEELEIGLEIKE